MKLSVIITCLNDSAQLAATISSIVETAGGRPEVVVVDDCSDTPVPPDDRYVLHRNQHRLGVGPSRHIGVLLAQGEHVLLTDSHMRFTPGWYDKVLVRLEGRPKTIHCAACLGLDSQHMDVAQPKGRYYGASLKLFGKDENAPGRYQVLEAVWNKSAPPEDDAEIQCLMGAAYFMPRAWFLKLGALRYLRSWGGDEVSLSLKSWLAGGDVRIMRDIGIGHVFACGNEQQPFKVPVGHVAHNKLFLIHTLLPNGLLRHRLMDMMMTVYGGGELATGRKLLQDNWFVVEEEIARNQRLFTRSFQWFADRHGIRW